MKNIIIALLGVISLSACTAMTHHQRENIKGESLQNHQNQKHPSIKNPQQASSIKDLDQGVERALGVKDLAVVAAIDIHGNIHLLKSKNVYVPPIEKTTFPIETNAITGMSHVSVVGYEGSRCVKMLHNVVMGGTFYTDFCRSWR